MQNENLLMKQKYSLLKLLLISAAKNGMDFKKQEFDVKYEKILDSHFKSLLILSHEDEEINNRNAIKFYNGKNEEFYNRYET